jgi:hypothetical protein
MSIRVLGKVTTSARWAVTHRGLRARKESNPQPTGLAQRVRTRACACAGPFRRAENWTPTSRSGRQRSVAVECRLASALASALTLVAAREGRGDLAQGGVKVLRRVFAVPWPNNTRRVCRSQR